jgi:hypothetical protein
LPPTPATKRSRSRPREPLELSRISMAKFLIRFGPGSAERKGQIELDGIVERARRLRLSVVVKAVVADCDDQVAQVAIPLPKL